MRKYNILKLNKKQLEKLRSEIVLNSLFYNDYKNSFDLDIHAVCDMFNFYLDFLQEEMKNNINNYSDSDFFVYLASYDNINTLYYFYKYEYLPCMEC